MLATIVVAAFAPSAWAGRLPGQPLSAPSGITQSPSVGYDDQGRGVAVWFAGTGSINEQLMASMHDAGGGWTAAFGEEA